MFGFAWLSIVSTYLCVAHAFLQYPVFMEPLQDLANWYLFVKQHTFCDMINVTCDPVRIILCLLLLVVFSTLQLHKVSAIIINMITGESYCK